jgi:L-gulonolactone oxidase
MPQQEVLAQLPLQSLYDALQPVTVPPGSVRASFTNWGQTFTCTPLAVFEPETEHDCELIFELSRREGKTVRAIGVGHSPSDLACTSGYMLRTTKLDQVLEVCSLSLHFIHPCLLSISTLIIIKQTHRIAYIPFHAITG